ncbi:hypothetical protein ZWY2020_017633 [Hordeum vulgare]|nr:hypothetical protein ZWY2020_017633 [Hordeum vulgare]
MDWVEQFNICDLKGPKNLPTSGPLSFTSRQFPREYYNVKSMKIKLICNFGGTFLPRPSDGELRYIGGDRHLMKISRDISWQELISKTTKLIGRAHTVKYHLPGEQLSMLISITSDDDLRHMIDECIVLEENRDDQHVPLLSQGRWRHVHFVVQGSSDAEKEAQFIALVNGVITLGYEPRAHSVGKSSVNDLDQLLFGISVEAGPPAGRIEEAAVSTKSKPLQSIAVPPVATSGQLERTPLSSQRRMINQYDSKPQSNEDSMISAARKTSKATGVQEKISPRKQLQIPLDNSSVTTQPSNSLRKNTNLQAHKKVEISEPSDQSGSPGCNTSANLQYPERSVAANSIQKNQPAGPATSVLPFASTPLDKRINLQPNTLVRASSDTIQERPSSPTADEHSSEIIRFRSVGTGIINPQIRAPLHEAEDDASPSIPEAELRETKSSEKSLPANAVLGRDLMSNVQIFVRWARSIWNYFSWKMEGTDVAIKRINNSCFSYQSSQADKLITEFWREAAIISKLHHPNILALYGVVNNGPGGTLATVTEFMVNGSLKKVLSRKDKYLDWRKRLLVAMDAAIGMEYLHSKDIVHFDLKCDNLLVNVKDPSRPICKVCHNSSILITQVFLISVSNVNTLPILVYQKMKQATMVSGGMRGTLPWMAPALLTMSGTKVSEKVDVYSFGVVMWEILTGEDPYDGMHYGGVIGGILSDTLRPPVPASCNPEWRKLMEQCWSTEPERRPSFTEVATCLRCISSNSCHAFPGVITLASSSASSELAVGASDVRTLLALLDGAMTWVERHAATRFGPLRWPTPEHAAERVRHAQQRRKPACCARRTRHRHRPGRAEATLAPPQHAPPARCLAQELDSSPARTRRLPPQQARSMMPCCSSTMSDGVCGMRWCTASLATSARWPDFSSVRRPNAQKMFDKWCSSIRTGEMRGSKSKLYFF